MKRLKRTDLLELLVIQPTPFCNLNCDYCYLPGRSSTHRISQDVLRKVFEGVLASRYVSRSFTVVWHAGEPLVMPIEFYEDAFALIDEVNDKGLEITHSLQTNGTLIDSNWCRFIERNHVKLGVSVDGPAFLHDAHRKTWSGKGTHERVMRGIRCLQDHGIGFHVISVLTDQALDYPDELFQFYVDHGIGRVGFNIEEVEGENSSSTLDSERSVERVRAFMTRFLELVTQSGSTLWVREFQGLQGFIAAGSGLIERSQENTPLRILSVDWAGNFSTFSPELLGLKSDLYGDFLLGNVLRDDLASIERTPKFITLKDDVEAGIAQCKKTCEYYGVCGGGSPSNKYFENGSFRSTETMHCRLSRKVLVDVLLENLETTLGLRAVAESVPS